MPDDGLSLHTLQGYFEKPIADIAKSALLVVTPTYRPLAGLFYRMIFAFVGLDPFPFRVACFVLLLVNLPLTYFLAKRLSSSVAIALLTTFLISYHPGLADLYYSTGTVYDILCYLFYALALLYYVRLRQSGRTFSWRQVATLLLLYSCALESKEMAVTLPLSILTFELLNNPPSLVGLLRNRALLGTFLLTVPFSTVKLFSKNPLSTDPMYHPRLSPRFILYAFSHYYDILFYQDHYFNAAKVLILWAVLFGLAHLLRSRPMKFGLCFSVFGMLPVGVIDPPHAGFVLYVPAFGLALYAATLTIEASTILMSRLPGKLQPGIAGAAVMVAAMLPLHYSQRFRHIGPALRYQEDVRNVMRQFSEYHPKLEHGAEILLLDDPLPADDWSLLFFLRLKYNDPAIWLDRSKMLNRAMSDAELTLYDHIFSYTDGMLRELPIHTGSQRCAPAGRVKLTFLPPRVRSGESYAFVAPGYEGETIDVAYELSVGQGTYSGVTRKWCALDVAGQATLVTPTGHPKGIVRIKRIRTQQGCWTPAEGSIEVVR